MRSTPTATRDADLRDLGFTVLRYSHAEIHKNFRGVCEDILNHINQNKGTEHMDYTKLKNCELFLFDMDGTASE